MFFYRKLVVTEDQDKKSLLFSKVELLFFIIFAHRSSLSSVPAGKANKRAEGHTRVPYAKRPGI